MICVGRQVRFALLGLCASDSQCRISEMGFWERVYSAPCRSAARQQPFLCEVSASKPNMMQVVYSVFI